MTIPTERPWEIFRRFRSRRNIQKKDLMKENYVSATESM
jgi:hypothetical protein